VYECGGEDKQLLRRALPHEHRRRHLSQKLARVKRGGPTRAVAPGKKPFWRVRK